MIDVNVLRSLEATIGKPMQYHLSEMGLWFRIFRESGVRNIPARVDFADMLATLNDAPPLEIAMGLGENRRVIKFNFQQDNTAHMLIAGATGTGKTNTIHVIINTLIRRDPAEVRLLLIDLKRCEFPIYNGLPHLIRPTVTEIDQVLDSVRMMYEEMNRRIALFEHGKGRTANIREYNRTQKRDNKLSYWVCIFDEFAILTDKKTKAAKEVIELFCDIGRLGRAAGIHCVLATQRPDRDVILPQLKTNFPGKIALACADVANSKVIIDSGDACFRDRDIPPGRAIMARGRFRDPFQTAFISKDTIASFIGDAEAGRFYTRRPAHDVTVHELARYALDNLDGIFDQARLGAMFKVRGITYHEVRELSQRHRGEPFQIDGADYILCQRGRKKPVMVEKMSDHADHGGGQRTDDKMIDDTTSGR
jgi:S-DNA-T family DNA segregation ATPase FtsK/SpoIIIE